MTKKRKAYSPEFKAKVALEAVKEQSTMTELSARFGVPAVLIFKWKKALVENTRKVFERGSATQSADDIRREELLLKTIGELTVERDFLARGLRRWQ